MSWFILLPAVLGVNSASCKTLELTPSYCLGSRTRFVQAMVVRGKPLSHMFVPTTVRGGTSNAPPGLQANAAERESSSPGLVDLVATDFRTVFTTKENLLVAGAGLAAAWGAHTFDEDIASSELNSEVSESTTLDHIFEAGEILGGWPVQFGGAVLAYGFGKVLSRRGVEDLGRDLLRAQLLTQPITFAIKVGVRRERPDGSDRRSFPSGHATGAFATATVLQRRYGWKAGVPAYGVAGYIAGSRLNEAKHYLSDIVFGAAVGIIGGRSVKLDLNGKGFALSPTLIPGGFGFRLSAWEG